MKFRYGYRTKENEKVEGVISASSREDVYAQLKREGKKPYMVEPLPGLLNRLSGISKRWIFICFLAGLCAVLGAVLASALRTQNIVLDTIDSETRRQVIGDVAVIDKGIREGWASVFPEEGERFLASFAIPGVPAGLRNTTEDEIKAALARKVVATSDDSLEVRQIKAMVEGMKSELRTFLSDGGTIKQYGRRLVQRQESELSYYRRAKAELDQAVAAKRERSELSALAEKHNAALRKIGVKLLILPE